MQVTFAECAQDPNLGRFQNLWTGLIRVAFCLPKGSVTDIWNQHYFLLLLSHSGLKYKDFFCHIIIVFSCKSPWMHASCRWRYLNLCQKSPGQKMSFFLLERQKWYAHSSGFLLSRIKMFKSTYSISGTSENFLGNFFFTFGLQILRFSEGFLSTQYSFFFLKLPTTCHTGKKMVRNFQMTCLSGLEKYYHLESFLNFIETQ